jgi:MoaA/NifB/PqqE/SkfB family radical SAM enzyme
MPTFAPTQLFYLTSLACNERCSKCAHWQVRDHPRMVDPDLLIEAVRGIPSAEELCIVGGEPLLFRRRVLRIIAGIADTRVRTTLVTNGVRCTPEFIDALVGRRVHLVFSIDTLDREMWRWVRGTDSMDTVLHHFETVRDRLAPEQLSVQSVLSEETREHVAAVGEWCAEMGVHHSVQPYVADGFGGSWRGLEGTPDGGVAPELDVGPCLAAGRNLSIMPDGTVFTCFQQNLIPDSERPIGVLGQQTIHEILACGYAQDVVARMFSCERPCKVLKCNR